MSETTADARSGADGGTPDDEAAAAVAVPSPDGGDAAAEDPPAGDAAPPDRRRRQTVLTGGLVLAMALAVVAGLVAASLSGQLSEERNERAEVARVAGSMAAALLTYDYEDLEGARDRVLSLSTGKFRTEYRTAFEGLRTLLSEAKASSRGSVTDVYLNLEDGAPTASAIVVVNTVAEGTAGRRATVASYIQLDLVKVEGDWRVDGVTNLNFGGAPVDLGRQPEAPAGPAPASP